MKILFVNRLFQDVAGGIERISVDLMNGLIERNYSVELLSWDKHGAEARYPMNTEIIWHKIGTGDRHKKTGWVGRLIRLIKIRRLIIKVKPDVVLAFQHGPFFTLAIALLFSNIPIIAAERSGPSKLDFIKAKKWKFLIFQTYRLASLITVQFSDYVKGYPAYLHSRIVHIPNSVQPVTHRANPAKRENGSKQLLCVGRLSYPKNQSLLIEAFSLIEDSFKDWNLVFVGDGENEVALNKLVKEKNLQSRVLFYPNVRDVNKFYLESQILCLPSQWEGFPNVVAEAMAHGLPVVGYEGCSGVSHLVDSGLNGLLAKGNANPETLAYSLAILMGDPVLRCEMGREAALSIKKYDSKIILDRWEEAFKKVVHKI
jgi:GalNAc-alpha-(1->4)-GalNAc-alpha-(1->3)-diNAcBac-PP-undecaprenol alpha-1,4-N-acetyl-D-galactosaminyltransferase